MDKLILGKLSYLLLFSESRQLDVKTLDGPYNKKKRDENIRCLFSKRQSSRVPLAPLISSSLETENRSAQTLKSLFVTKMEAIHFGTSLFMLMASFFFIWKNGFWIIRRHNSAHFLFSLGSTATMSLGSKRRPCESVARTHAQFQHDSIITRNALKLPRANTSWQSEQHKRRTEMTMK